MKYLLPLLFIFLPLTTHATCGNITVGSSFTTPVQSFGWSGVQKNAQSFTPGCTGTYSKVTFDAFLNSGTPAHNVLVSIQADSGGSPSGTPLGTATVAASFFNLGTCVQSANTVFDSNISLTSGNTYWFVITTDVLDSSNTDGSCGDSPQTVATYKYLDVSSVWQTLTDRNITFTLVEATAAGITPTSILGLVQSFFIW